MAALIPYAARAALLDDLIKFGKKRFPSAAQTAKGINYAGKVYQDVKKPRKRQKVVNDRKFGAPPQTARYKSSISNGQALVDTLEVINITELIGPGNEPNERKYNYVDLAGISNCYHFHNSNPNEGVVFHVALIQLHSIPLNSTNTRVADELFTMPGTSAGEEGKSGIDFDNPGLTRTMKNCIPINTKKWKVFFHEKRLFCGRREGNGSAPVNMRSFNGDGQIQKYTKVKQRIHYEGGSGGEAYKPIYMISWMEPWSIAANDSATLLAGKYERTTKLFFLPQ